MTPYYSDSWLTVYQGDCREVMASMEPESVHCVVTSPPYWGLRDYGDDGQLGLEPTPEAYVENMVAVFREVRRVLRSDGTVWLNLGDSYAQSANTGGTSSIQGSAKRVGAMNSHTRAIPVGLKQKDLVGIPWMVAFALRADGWYLRSDIIWSKPNPMPESVTDRPTKSHEYLFLLSKLPRYYFDGGAVAVPAAYGGHLESPYSPPGQEPHKGAHNDWQGKHRTSVERGGFNGKTEAMPGRNAFRAITETRNIRSVWTVATQPYPGAHFATFPEKLIEPCIKAGSPELGTILDPFAGSGTSGRVAQRLGRRAILIDLNADYLTQAMVRNQDIPLGLESA